MTGRRTPPDHRDPQAFAGLTLRRLRLGLPVSRPLPNFTPQFPHPHHNRKDTPK